MYLLARSSAADGCAGDLALPECFAVALVPTFGRAEAPFFEWDPDCDLLALLSGLPESYPADQSILAMCRAKSCTTPLA